MINNRLTNSPSWLHPSGTWFYHKNTRFTSSKGHFTEIGLWSWKPLISSLSVNVSQILDTIQQYLSTENQTLKCETPMESQFAFWYQTMGRVPN